MRFTLMCLMFFVCFVWDTKPFFPLFCLFLFLVYFYFKILYNASVFLGCYYSKSVHSVLLYFIYYCNKCFFFLPFEWLFSFKLMQTIRLRFLYSVTAIACYREYVLIFVIYIFVCNIFPLLSFDRNGKRMIFVCVWEW